MYMKLTCVKNSMNGQDIYTCVKETKPTDNVEHFGFAQNDDRINKFRSGTAANGNNVVKYLESAVPKYSAGTDRDYAIDQTLYSPTVKDRFQCNGVTTSNINPPYEDARKANEYGVLYHARIEATTEKHIIFNQNDLYKPYDFERTKLLPEWRSIRKASGERDDSAAYVCVSNTNPIKIENTTQLFDKVWKSAITYELGTEKCNISNICMQPAYTTTNTLNPNRLRSCPDFKCVAMPKKGNQGYWMDINTPTVSGQPGALPILNYTPANYTVKSNPINKGTNLLEYNINNFPTWVKYVDITVIAPGGSGGRGGNGYHKDRTARNAPYDRTGSGGGGGGSGGYVKIKRLYLGQILRKPNVTGEYIVGFTVNYVAATNTITVTNFTSNAQNIFTLASVTSGTDGPNGTSGGSSNGNGVAVGGGSKGSYYVNPDICGNDQISTKGGNGGGSYGNNVRDGGNGGSGAVHAGTTYGAGGKGGYGGNGNTGGAAGSGGAPGCVIVTYYYNSTDESSIED